MIPHHVQVGDFHFFISNLAYNNVADSSIHNYGCHEPWLTQKFVENLTKDDVLYDIGAANGYYTLLASFITKNIYAFEPNKISKRIQNNSITTKKFVSDKDDEFNVSLDKCLEDTRIYTVPTVLKIDVEGAETKVIRGAKQLIESHKPKYLWKYTHCHLRTYSFSRYAS